MHTEPNTENNTSLREGSNKKSVSNHIEEIMTTPPSWIMKWGSLIIIGIVSFITIIAANIPAPQSLKVNITIKDSNGTALVVSKKKGMIKILLHDGDQIQKDQLIGYIESNVNPLQVMALLKKLNNFKQSNKEKDIGFTRFANLGGLEIGYYQLQLSYLMARDTKKKSSNNTFMSSKPSSNMNPKLSGEEIVFARELSSYIFELQKWIEENTFTSPVTGKLSFLGLVGNGAKVEIDQKIFLVKSVQSKLLGEAKINQKDMEYIRKGSKAIIRLFGNPSGKKVNIIGRVDYISSIPIDTVYMVKILFDTEHIPNSIAFAQDMKFNAEIMTGEGSLLTSFINSSTKGLISN